jgi:hypothetical protein
MVPNHRSANPNCYCFVSRAAHTIAREAAQFDARHIPDRADRAVSSSIPSLVLLGCNVQSAAIKRRSRCGVRDRKVVNFAHLTGIVGAKSPACDEPRRRELGEGGGAGVQAGAAWRRLTAKANCYYATAECAS